MSASLLEAAATGDLEYIRTNAKAIKDKNERGWTALHFAARYGQLAVAQYLRDSAPDLLEMENNEGKTAAQLAQFWGYDAVADLLAPPTLDTSTKETTAPVTKQVNHVNFFAGSPLNRYGWYRTNNDKLNELVRSNKARFLLFNKLDPLFQDSQLYLATADEVKDFIGDFGSDNDEQPALVFLGIDDKQEIPYWALDVTVKPKSPYKERLERYHQELEKAQLEFSSALPLAFKLKKDVAAILAQGRAMMDWHKRNRFCPACGEAVVSKEAGHKLMCTSNETSECISHKGIHNFAYPRTDAVVIVCIIHPTEDKILLGRQKQWPARMFSCIAGFVEAGESIEEAVRREALEETGVHVDHVAYHSTQPWPFPNSLMFGFLASATTDKIKMEDKELESARWFSRSDVLGALKGDGVFTLPPNLAIAYQLIHSWATHGRQSSKI